MGHLCSSHAQMALVGGPNGLNYFLHVSEKVRRVWFVFKWRSRVGVDQWSQGQEFCRGESEVPERLGVDVARLPCDYRFSTNKACPLHTFRQTDPPIPTLAHRASPNVVLCLCVLCIRIICKEKKLCIIVFE